jgi:hypothetical protein
MPPFVGDSFGDSRAPRRPLLRRFLRRFRRQPGLVLVDWDSKRRVAAGAAWLNAVEPGWISRIDLEDLDVASVRRCVCAQVFGPGGFKRIKETYGRSWAWNHGFFDTADTAVWVALVLRSRRPGGAQVEFARAAAHTHNAWERQLLQQRTRAAGDRSPISA